MKKGILVLVLLLATSIVSCGQKETIEDKLPPITKSVVTGKEQLDMTIIEDMEIYTSCVKVFWNRVQAFYEDKRVTIEEKSFLAEILREIKVIVDRIAARDIEDKEIRESIDKFAKNFDLFINSFSKFLKNNNVETFNKSKAHFNNSTANIEEAVERIKKVQGYK